MDLQAYRDRRAAGKKHTPITDEAYIDQIRDMFEAARKHFERHHRLYVYFTVNISDQRDVIWLNWMIETKYDVYNSYSFDSERCLTQIAKTELGKCIISCVFFPKGVTIEEIKAIFPSDTITQIRK